MNKTARIIGGIVVFIVFSLVFGLLKSADIQLGAIPYMGIILLFLFIFSRVTGWDMRNKNKKN